MGDETDGERADDPNVDFDAGTEWSVALTAKGNLAVYVTHCNDRFPPELETYESVQELLEAESIPANVKALVSEEMGGDYSPHWQTLTVGIIAATMKKQAEAW